jgi:parallel beta-helix repeat protein
MATSIIALVAPNPTTPGSAWSPSSLGVAWASDFGSLAENEINVKTDPRLTVHAAGDGITDDTSAISAAVQLASSSGGGVVYLPTGNYKIITPSNATAGSPLVVPSRVILRGDSSTASLISVNDPNAAGETGGFWTWGGISFQGSSLSGMTDLGVSFVNPSSTPCATIWNLGSTGSSELFFNNLNVQMGNNRTFWFINVNELLVQGSDLSTGDAQNQTASQAGAVYLTGNSNVSVLNNTISYSFGRMHMENNTNVLIQGNTITRNAENSDMENGTAIESGGVELSFSQNVQVLNNTVETLNAPTNELGDGEAIMAQNSGTGIQDQGAVTSITSTTLTDTSALWGSTTSSAVASGVVIVAMTSGAGVGEWRTVTGINTSTKTLTVSPAFSPVPSTGDLYSLTEWPIMNATIQGNTLTGNPNGIIIYDGCYNCTIESNTLTDSRDILLRVDSVNSSYGESRGVHEVAITNSILKNTVTNMSGIRPAFIALDTEAFASAGYSGMGEYDIQVGGNTINPYAQNPSLSYNNPPTEIPQDGIFPCFLYGPAPSQASGTTVFQNINFWADSESAPVTYIPGFLPFTNQACVTPSAPPN